MDRGRRSGSADWQPTLPHCLLRPLPTNRSDAALNLLSFEYQTLPQGRAGLGRAREPVLPRSAQQKLDQRTARQAAASASPQLAQSKAASAHDSRRQRPRTDSWLWVSTKAASARTVELACSSLARTAQQGSGCLESSRSLQSSRAQARAAQTRHAETGWRGWGGRRGRLARQQPCRTGRELIVDVRLGSGVVLVLEWGAAARGIKVELVPVGLFARPSPGFQVVSRKGQQNWKDCVVGKRDSRV